MRKYGYVMLMIISCTIIMLSGCESVGVKDNPSISTNEWELMLDSANNTVVHLIYGDKDDVKFKKWIENSIIPMAREKGITLKIQYRSIDDVIKKLQRQMDKVKINPDDKEVNVGYFDIVYITDDSFYKMFKNEYLYQSFLEKLPNYYRYIYPDNVEFIYEQGLETVGSYIPITSEQLSFVYDEDMIDYPPDIMDELLDIVKSSPQQFTFPLPNDVSGRLFMHTFIAHYVDYERLYTAELTKDELERIISPALESLRDIKPNLWKNGSSYPSSESELDDLFFKGEIAFSLSTDPNKPLRLSKEERYPYAARGFVLDDGTAGTNGGVVIPFNAPNKSGAMIVINDMLSVQAQADKYDPMFWGNIPIINTDMIEGEEASAITKIQIKRNNVKEESFNLHRLPKIPKKNSDIIAELWKRTMLE